MAALAASGCTVPEPPGAAPLRYRDPIFSNVTVTSGLRYGSAPDEHGDTEALTLDMYRPAGDTQTRRPAIVWLHPGALTGGSSTNPNMVALSREFAERGYVAVSINYRLRDSDPCQTSDITADCTQAHLDAQHDGQAAVRWLRANASTYGIDPTRIAAGGASAGAVTALLMGNDAQDVGTSGNPGYSSRIGAAISISGALPPALDSTWTPDDAPTLFFNGTADTGVPYLWAVEDSGQLYNDGVLTAVEVLQGAGHDPFDQYSSQFTTQSAYFAYYALDLAHADGQPPSQARAIGARSPALDEPDPSHGG